MPYCSRSPTRVSDFAPTPALLMLPPYSPATDLMTSAVFITGTDTGIGKTLVSAALLAALNRSGRRAVGMKPVASGCEPAAVGPRNADADLLIAHSAGSPDYHAVNPYALADAIAPHLAAAAAGSEIRLDPILAGFAALSTNADCIIVEGVGGWAVPLSPALMQADLARALKLPVIFVVGLRLGCINHALLSARAIAADGCALIGWIGNRIDPAMACVDENIATLRERLPAPCLGVLPFAASPSPHALAAVVSAAVDLLSRGP